MGFFDDIAKSFSSWESVLGTVLMGGPGLQSTVGAGLVGSGVVDKESTWGKILGVGKYFDPITYGISKMMQKPEEAEAPPEAPQPPEYALKNALANYWALQQQQAKRKYQTTYGGTLKTSPLGVPGKAPLYRQTLTGA